MHIVITVTPPPGAETSEFESVNLLCIYLIVSHTRRSNALSPLQGGMGMGGGRIDLNLVNIIVQGPVDRSYYYLM